MEQCKECPMIPSDVSLRELRDILADVARVGEEVWGLSEIFQWRGEVAKGLLNWTACDKEHLEEELSDVLLYLIQLDLGRAALTKISKNVKKKNTLLQMHTFLLEIIRNH